MSNVEFSEEKAYEASLERHRTDGVRERGLIGLVIRLGIAKDRTGANIMLIALAVLAVLLAVALFWLGGGTP